MIKLIGAALIVFCGAAAGSAVSGEYKRRYEAICSAADMLEQMLLMLEFEAPTVSQLMNGVKNGAARPPEFVMRLADKTDSQSICAALESSPGGLNERDIQKLKELFTRLGTADKTCERQRILSVLGYFNDRRETERGETEKKAKLARTLGVLGGIFAATLLI